MSHLGTMFFQKRRQLTEKPRCRKPVPVDDSHIHPGLGKRILETSRAEGADGHLVTSLHQTSRKAQELELAPSHIQLTDQMDDVNHRYRCTRRCLSLPSREKGVSARKAACCRQPRCPAFG